MSLFMFNVSEKQSLFLQWPKKPSYLSCFGNIDLVSKLNKGLPLDDIIINVCNVFREGKM